MLAKRHLNNEKGIAVVEMIPVMIIVMLLLSFAFGFFGVIHTGILNSIAARNYAFETFNHRSDLRYFRSTNLAEPKSYYQKQQYRIHAIVSDARPVGDLSAMATARQIVFGWSFAKVEAIGNTSQKHRDDIFNVKDDGTRYTQDGVNPVWIQSSYGICLTSQCKP